MGEAGALIRTAKRVARGAGEESCSPGPTAVRFPSMAFTGRAEGWPCGTHFVEVDTPEAMRRLLGPADAESRQQRDRTYLTEGRRAARMRLPLGMHDRFERFIFADGPLHGEDAGGIEHHLPAHVKVIRETKRVIGTGQVFEVSTTHRDWESVHFRDELYVHLCVDVLIVEPGATLAVQGNVLVVECGRIEMRGDAVANGAAPVFDISIGPTPHPAFGYKLTFPARDGAPGVDGRPGRAGCPALAVDTPFGRRLIAGPGDPNGGDGGDGTDGSHGALGQNGGMAMLADIRVGELVGFGPGSLRIRAQAGRGCAGGAGGDGGQGGLGGGGADGGPGMTAPLPGGRGGSGGRGGEGGRGGRGGNGGLSSDIFVELPAAQAECVDPCSLDSPGGVGGGGGRPGAGGVRGCDGKHATGSGRSVSSGVGGAAGKTGQAGKPRPGAIIHILGTGPHKQT